MDTLELRKARLDIVVKLSYPFLAVLGYIIAYFQPKVSNEINSGNLLALALAAFSIPLLIAMFIYIFQETSCLKYTDENLNEDDKERNYLSYENIFVCFRLSSRVLLFYTFLLIAMSMYFQNWFDIFAPSKFFLSIALALNLCLSFLPSDVHLSLLGFNTKGNTRKDNIELSNKCFEYNIFLNKIKKCHWPIWSFFTFNLLYLVWFT